MSKSFFSGAGYFMNDDRASGGKLDEDDILVCAHHGSVMKKSEWKKRGGMCMACGEPICAHCYDRTKKFGCEGPEQKRIEQAVNDLHRQEQNAKMLGI